MDFWVVVAVAVVVGVGVVERIMIFPDDLPSVIEYRLGTVETFRAKCGSTGEWTWRTRQAHVKATYPTRPVAYVSTSGATNAAIICPRIPYGCTGWREGGHKAWRSLSEIPQHWLPFLNRERETEMDPRQCPVKEAARDAERKRQKELRKREVENKGPITGG